MKATRYSRLRYTVPAVALLFTVIGAYYASQFGRLEVQSEFDKRVDQLRYAVVERLQAYVNTLVQTRGLFVASKQVTGAEFADYIASMDILENYPGTQGIGYTVRIRAEDLKRHEEEKRRAGSPSYRVWPEDPRPDYFSIVFLEPLDWRNKRAIGYDMFTEPVRRDAMAEARDTGQPVASGRVTLVQETHVKPQPGFLIYVPLYDAAKPTDTVERRRQALLGFIYSPFRAGDFFDAILRYLGPGFTNDVVVGAYAGEGKTDGELLFDNGWTDLMKRPAGKVVDGGQFVRHIGFHLAGRSWTLKVASSRVFETQYQSTRLAAPLILFMGLLVSGMLYWTMDANRRQALTERAFLKQEQNARVMAEEGRHREQQSRSEAEAAKRRVEFLYQATSAIMTERLDRLTRFGRLAEVVVPAFADWCIVDVSQKGSNERRAEIVHRDPRKTAFARNIEMSASMPKAQRTGQPMLYENVSEAELFHVAGELGLASESIVAELGILSCLTVPLLARGHILGSLSFVYSESGRRYGKDDVALAQELARRAAVAIENVRLYQQAAEATRAREDLLAVVSHDLQNPLAAIEMSAAVIKRFLANEAGDRVSRAAKQAESIIRASERMRQLIGDLLDSARIEAGQFSVEPRVQRPGELVQEALELFQPLAAQKKVKLQAVSESALPAVLCDRERTIRVLSNLIGNALKFTPAGGEVMVSASRNDGTIVFEVRDTGQGIEPEHLQHIFDRYWTKGAEKRGTGLGLFIAKGIVEAHKGAIWTRSAPGAGSSFYFTLPVAAETPSYIKPVSGTGS